MKEIKIDGKRYVLNEDFNGSEPCANCPLKDKCPDAEYYYCKTFIGVKKPFEDVTECVTEEKAYDDYQERSNTANDRGEQLAWAFIVLLAGMMIGNHGYLEYYVGAACGLAYLLLSMIQSAWQTIAIWIVKNRIKRDNLTIEDYPEWVGGWAWVFWYTKIGLLTIGTIYVAYRFVSPLFDI